jgi:hypothetical protein
MTLYLSSFIVLCIGIISLIVYQSLTNNISDNTNLFAQTFLFEFFVVAMFATETIVLYIINDLATKI